MRLIPIACCALLLSNGAAAADCTAASAERRVPLLELYTSEGCDSCPPTDRWVSELRARGYGADRVVVLAFHVDYWDKLGWIDRYGQSRFSERQRLVNSRIGSRVVYTPQLVLNGRDYRRGSSDDFDHRVADVARGKAAASIRLDLKPATDRLTVSGAWSATVTQPAQAWLALYENRLSSEITSGENRNKRLQHDFVVRDIAGPFPSGPLTHVFKLDKGWKRPDLAVASFVQDPRSGDTLQALALGVCESRPM